MQHRQAAHPPGAAGGARVPFPGMPAGRQAGASGWPGAGLPRCRAAIWHGSRPAFPDPHHSWPAHRSGVLCLICAWPCTHKRGWREQRATCIHPTQPLALPHAHLVASRSALMWWSSLCRCTSPSLRVTPISRQKLLMACGAGRAAGRGAGEGGLGGPGACTSRRHRAPGHPRWWAPHLRRHAAPPQPRQREQPRVVPSKHIPGRGGRGSATGRGLGCRAHLIDGHAGGRHALACTSQSKLPNSPGP